MSQTEVVLPDYSFHGRYWIVDLERRRIARIAHGLADSQKPLERRGFVKNFLLGGPLGVGELEKGCFLFWQSNIVPLDSNQLTIRASWNVLIANVRVIIGTRDWLFVDVSPFDAVTSKVDPTWDQTDSEIRNVAAAFENWVSYAKGKARSQLAVPP